MESYREEPWFNVQSRRGFVNIAPQVETCLQGSGIREGLCVVNLGLDRQRNADHGAGLHK